MWRLSLEEQYFFQLFISVIVSVGNGAIFCFGIFSPFMKAAPFSLDQTQVNIVSTCGAVLSYFSLPTGIIFDRYGPKVTLLTGAVFNFIGWLGMYLIFCDLSNPILGTGTATMAFFFGVSQWSASFYETGSVLTNLEAMSQHKGRVVIIQKTFMGLGSSIITQVYLGYFQGRAPISSFFLFLAVFNTVVGVIGAFTIRLPEPSTRVVGLNEDLPTAAENTLVLSTSAAAPPTGPLASRPPLQTAAPTVPIAADSTTASESSSCLVSDPGAGDANARRRLAEQYAQRFDRPFRYGVALLLLVVVYIAAITIAEAYVPITGTWRDVLGTCTVLLLLAFAIMVPLVPESRTPFQSPADGSHPRRFYRSVAVGDEDALQAPDATSSGRADRLSSDEKEPVADTGTPRRDSSEIFATEELNGYSLAVNMKTRDMWLMWIVSFAVWGTGTVVSANSTQIYQSLDFDNYSTTLDSVYVSIYGVASAVGRIIVGFGEQALRKRGLHVARMFVIAPVINVVGIPLFFILPANALIVAFFLSGLATGVTWGSTVLIIKNVFAPNNCGKHYNILYTAGMLTPLLMNTALFGPLYDRESDLQQRQSTRTCSGAACVIIPLLLSWALNVVACPCSWWFRNRVIANRKIS